jgi:hypothetical protein
MTSTRVVALVLSAVALALPGCGGSGSRVPVSSAPVSLSVLRDRRTLNERPPSWVAEKLQGPDGSPLPSNDISMARKVLRHQRAWVVPVPGAGICLVRIVRPLVPFYRGRSLPPTVSQTCLPPGEVMHGGLRESQSLSTSFKARLPTLVDGIVPDGVSHVVIHFADHSSRSVGVSRNSYEATVVNPYSLTFFTGAGRSRRRSVVPIPSAAGAGPDPARLEGR